MNAEMNGRFPNTTTLGMMDAMTSASASVTMAASYFNGLSGKRHVVEMRLLRGQVYLIGLGIWKHFQPDAVHMTEAFAHTPCVLEFDDGSRCEIEDEYDKLKLHAALGAHQPCQPAHRQALPPQWRTIWSLGLFALVIVMLALAAVYRSGMPFLAEQEAALANLPVQPEVVVPEMSQRMKMGPGLALAVDECGVARAQVDV